MRANAEDDRVRSAVEHRLAQDFLIDESQIEVEVAHGVVTLVGTVGSYAEKVVAQNSARSLIAVHDLVNAIDVKPAADMNPGDAELQAMVEQLLSWDALVPEANIEVSVSDGLVALTGSCVASAQVREAERAVSHLGGVRGVLNRIEVTEPELTTDQVREVIVDALHRRAAHQASQINVVVDGSTVTLNGIVQSAMDKRAIVGAVGHAPGIGDLRDELRVSGSVPG